MEEKKECREIIRRKERGEMYREDKEIRKTT